MIVPFDTLPENSKVWIYQSSRLMSSSESLDLQKNAEAFVDTWTAHQAGLKAGVKVLKGYFIVIAVDESYNNASGCSIDKQVHFIQEMGLKMNIDFFNRMNVAYKKEDGIINLIKVSDMNELIDKGELNLKTNMFNNLIANIDEFHNKWQVPLESSWAMSFVSARKENN